MLKNFYKKQQFQPSYWALLFNPYFTIRRALYLQIKQLAVQLKGQVLDFGCGAKPYQDLFQCEKYIGLDIENPGHDHSNEHIDVFYDGKTIPFENESFDGVFSSEVFEHVFGLNDTLHEINRILKPEGLLLISTPFVWNEHEIPYDFGRYSAFGMEWLLKEHGFEVITLKRTTRFPETLCQLTMTYLFEMPKIKHKNIKLAWALALSPINILLHLFGKILPGRFDFYHNIVVLAKKKNQL